MIHEIIPTRLDSDRLTRTESEQALNSIMKLLSFIGSRSDSIHLSNIANSCSGLLITALNMEKEVERLSHENEKYLKDLINLKAEKQKGGKK